MSTLVKMQYCWKSHVAAHIYLVIYMISGGTTLYVSHIKNITIVLQKEATLVDNDTSSVFIRSLNFNTF